MAIFDSLISEAAEKFGLGDKAGGLLAGLLSVVTNSESGGLTGLLSKFTGAGLGDVVSSWIGGGASQSITGDQITSVLGNETVNNIAANAGISPGTAAPALAFMLPQVVDKLTPDGVVPTSLPDTIMGYIGNLGGMVGKGITGAAGLAGAAALGAAGLAGSAASGAADLAGSAVSGVGDLAGKGVDLAGKGIGAVGDLAGKGIDAVGDLAGGTAGAVGAAAGAVGAGLAGAAGAGMAGAKAATEFAGETAKSGASMLLKLLPLLLLLAVAYIGYRACSTTTPTNSVATTATTAASAVTAVPSAAASVAAALDPAAAVKNATEAATLALGALKPGFTADELVKALNLEIINFASGSNAIPKENEELLTKSAAAIKQAPAGTKLEVGGHTDNTGNAAGNEKLSAARAAAVKAFLEKAGVGAGVLSAKGYGSSKPVASNDTPEGKFKNRRIEFSVVK